MKKISLLCILLVLAVMLQSVPVAVFAEGDAFSDVSSLDARMSLGGSAQRLETARGALLYEVNTGTMLYTWNPDTRLHPASLVKIMTVLIALEEGSLDDPVAITADMMHSLRESDLSTDLQEGEQVTLGDLVYLSMVASNNASAALIGMHLYRSENAFVERMNQRASELGCENTHFTNSHGIPDEKMYTTARDMARIVLYALENETFCEIFGATNYTIPQTNLSEARSIKTTNYFLSNEVIQKFHDPRVTGGKSGAASTDDRSIVFTAESGGLTLLAVVLGAEGEMEEDGHALKRHGCFEEGAVLMDFGFDHFTSAQILFEGKAMEQFSVAGGANDVVGRPAASVFSALPVGTQLEDLRWEYVLLDSLAAPVEAGQVIGTVRVWSGNFCVAQTDMVSMNRSALAEYQVQEQPRDGEEEQENDGWTTLLIVLAIIGGAAAVLMLLVWGLNAIRRAVLTSRRRKRRPNRRRSR